MYIVSEKETATRGAAQAEQKSKQIKEGRAQPSVLIQFFSLSVAHHNYTYTQPAQSIHRPVCERSPSLSATNVMYYTRSTTSTSSYSGSCPSLRFFLRPMLSFRSIFQAAAPSTISASRPIKK